jgi:amino acid adenylation domain-containing protein
VVERSPEMLVGLLGVLKAGAGYVPMDPGYPPERLAFMVADAQVAVLLTTEALVERLPGSMEGVSIVRLDSDWPAIAAGAGSEAGGEAGGDVGPEHLAYVIYTSGSTGKPKGVEVRHRNLVHSTTARYGYYPSDPKRYLLLSSYAFDSSVVGIFWTLCRGGALVLPGEGREREVRELGELIAAQEVTTLLALPSLHGLLLDHVPAEQLVSLDTVIVAGEACTRDLVERHRERLPETGLHNEYGPTEASVWCTVFDCTDLEHGRGVPIGRPIANSRVYLLDRFGEPVPLGAPGELYVGGEGVARGYLGRAELTAERFVPDPFGDGSEDARLYRTGDLARWLPDGNLEFLGRIDHQVKVRGYRVELGEIEDALLAGPGVAEAVVLAREDTPGDQRLVAYLVGRDGDRPDEEGALEGLRGRLPEYMLPGAFVTLPEIPRTPNGKVDRATLPAPDAARPSLAAAYVAPEGPVEESMAELWADVMGVERVGVEDSFFDLGGHSILAVRLVARLAETFQVEIQLRTLFDAPTVRGLIAALSRDPQQAKRLERAADLLAQLAQLSDEDVDAALEERAPGERAGEE